MDLPLKSHDFNPGRGRRPAVAALLGLAAASLVHAAGLDAPPFEVKAYLAWRHVKVSASELAVTRLAAADGKAPRAEVASLLAAAGMRPAKTLGAGTAIIPADDGAAGRLDDVTIQLGAQIAPVLSGSSPLRVVPLPRVVFRLAEDAKPQDFLPILETFKAGPPRSLRDREYAADLGWDAGPWSSLALAARLSEEPAVEWAVPDCVRETRKNYLPNDANTQWHIHNTNVVTWTNDISLHRAWDTTLGDPNVVIAIMDDGLDIAHPDLSANVWTNPLEIPDNDIDDDANGYVDDINGWDFCVDTNDIRPNDELEAHGTCVAGLAAARGDNGLGVCGAAPFCKLLTVKIYDGEEFVSDSQWVDALLYAARYAKVINISSSVGDALDAQIEAVHNEASTSSLIFASSANDADLGVYMTDCDYNYSVWGWTVWSQYVAGVGSHTYRWTYSKDVSESFSGDCAWLDGVVFTTGQRENFETGLPLGWTTGGHASWFGASESNDSMVIGAKSLRSGDIDDNERTWVQVNAAGAGYFTFAYQVYGERGCSFLGEGPFTYDGLSFAVDGVTNTYWPDANEDPVEWGMELTPVPYPAALTSVVAVGASAIDGFRAAYSCFDTNLELLAPSSGSAGETGIRTTDRVGADGYTATDYEDNFGGTSASAPIAAGVAALLFSANPYLSVHDARAFLRQGARKIGTIPYVGGFNTRYGYGQVDAGQAMRLMLSNAPPWIVAEEHNLTLVRFRVMGIETGRAYTVYRATGWDGTQWNWAALSNGLGAPIWGTNTTPIMEKGTATTHVYRIVK